MNPIGYPCPYCEYFAKWPTELQKHIMVHSKERPHRCVICGLSYKWKWDLGRHFDKSHHKGMNPYKKNGFTTSSTGTTRGSKRYICGRSTLNALHGMKKEKRTTTKQGTTVVTQHSPLNDTSLKCIDEHNYTGYTNRIGPSHLPPWSQPKL